MKTVRQATVYIGLSDSDSHEQKYEHKKYVKILREVCRQYHAAFSVDFITGGYFHEDGTYVDENSIELTFLDLPDETVKEIAKDLCTFFNQETVLVTYQNSEIHYIHEDLSVK